MLSIDEASQHPHNQSRGAFVNFAGAEQVAPTPRFSRTAPELAWRMTMASARIAFSVIAVSISVSPFFTLDCAACMLTTSAPSRLPAISNDSSVRVEFSKKALMIVSPASDSSRFCG